MTASPRLTFGFTTGVEREEVRMLEDLGVDSLWVGGHVAAPNGAPEAMVQLARLSAMAERARIGTSILLLPLYPPALVAKQIADLDRYTAGRVTLGVGVGGEYPGEFRACGVPIEERGRRADEAIGLIRRLWRAEEISHPGPFFPMEAVRIHPASARPGGPPIIVAGRKEPAMRRAARLGDGWFPYLYSPRAYGESVGKIRAFAADAGRELGDFEWMAFVFINIAEDGAAACEDMADFLGGTYSQDFRQFVDRVTACGTVDQVAERLQQFVDAGARHLVFTAGSRGNRRELMRRILTEVTPRLRLPAAVQA